MSLISLPARAQSHLYFQGLAGYAFADGGDIEGTDRSALFTARDLKAKGSLSGAGIIGIPSKLNIGGELEGHYLSLTTSKDEASQAASKEDVAQLSSMHTLGLVANAVWQAPRTWLGGDWAPYLGGGVGLSEVTINYRWQGDTQDREIQRHSWVVQGIAGVAYRLLSDTDILLDYRATKHTQNFGDSPSGHRAVTIKTPWFHRLHVGIRYTF